MIKVYDAMDILEANIVKGLLMQYDIDVHVGGFYLQGGVGELPAMGNTALWIDEDDESRAKSIIEKYKNNTL
jgi:hypothetical protein